jgi:antitoxin component of MazEF toxin-antitoxin module
MIKKLTKHGNSYAIIIDKPILELLNLAPTATVEITTDGASITITPVRRVRAVTQRVSNNQNLQQLVEKNLKKYKPLLKKLAQN